MKIIKLVFRNGATITITTCCNCETGGCWTWKKSATMLTIGKAVNPIEKRLFTIEGFQFTPEKERKNLHIKNTGLFWV